MIHEAFSSWKKSPITTKIETLPISEIKFPNVTICPPKNSYLNLNYDIIQSENITLGNDTRADLITSVVDELLNHEIDKIQEEIYNEVMRNLSKLEYPDRFYNWYHGLTFMKYPYYKWGDLNFFEYPTATSGNLTTQYFGDKFNASKVEHEFFIRIRVQVPESGLDDDNTTLMMEVKKKTMEELTDPDFDKMRFCNDCTDIDTNATEWSKNITAPDEDYYYIYLDRMTTIDVINNLELDMMPGFTFTWNYNRQLEPEAPYSSYDEHIEFVR